MPQINIAGESIHYEDAGSGPALVLLHSLGTGAWLWRGEIEYWRASHRVVAVDLRGHGQTSCRGGISMQANASDVEALMQALGLDDAVVIGLSMGGVVAARLAAIAPAGVRALVLADTFCHQPEGALRVSGVESKLSAMDMATYGRAYADETLRVESKAGHLDVLAEGIGRTSKKAYLATTRSLFLEDTRSILANLDQPVLVLWGDEDQHTPRAFSEEIIQLCSHARLEVLPQAAHLSNLDQPAAFRAAVDGFMRSVSRCC